MCKHNNAIILNRSLLEELARRTNTTPQDCFSLVEALRDADPLLGVKGCRFAVVNPEFLGMQVRAALGAGLQVIREGHKRMGTVQFMIPMISSEHETRSLVQMIQVASEEFFAAQVIQMEIMLLRMIMAILMLVILIIIIIILISLVMINTINWCTCQTILGRTAGGLLNWRGGADAAVTYSIDTAHTTHVTLHHSY
jgi:hypothetical protein